MSTSANQNFRGYLRFELKKRMESNPNYSLRSFARSLGISPSGLSSALSGKVKISPKFVQKVASKLKLSKIEIQKYQLGALETEVNPAPLKDYQIIDQDRFEVIKEWYHYAILNIIRVQGFKPQASWVARNLGISLGEVQTALERLQSVGLLKIENGQWLDQSNMLTTHTNNKKFSEAAKQNQIQLFSKASKAIEEVKFENRNHTGVTIAIKKEDLTRAKEKIAQFRREFTLEFDKQSGADEVYQISVALFPLTVLKRK